MLHKEYHSKLGSSPGVQVERGNFLTVLTEKPQVYNVGMYMYVIADVSGSSDTDSLHGMTWDTSSMSSGDGDNAVRAVTNGNGAAISGQTHKDTLFNLHRNVQVSLICLFTNFVLITHDKMLTFPLEYCIYISVISYCDRGFKSF